MDEKLLLLLCFAVLSSCVGFLLLRNERVCVPESEKENLVFFRPKHAEVWKKGWMLALLICSLIAAARLWGKGEALMISLRVLLLIAILWACAWTDLGNCIIPNLFVVTALLGRLALLGAEALLTPEDLPAIALSCGVSAAALLIVGVLCRLVAAGSLGYGDIKLMAVIGLYLGLNLTWNAIFYAMIAIFLFSFALLISKKAGRKSGIPFAPALLIGTLFTVFC